jgi:SagB-type dehydrogenase family enzyme
MTKHFAVAFFLLLIQSAALYAGDKAIALPKPKMHKNVSLEEAFNRTRTDRIYSEKPLTLAEISAVLWAAAGKRYDVATDAVTASTRTYPGLYTTSFCLMAGAVEGIEPGIYKYNWSDHSLELVKQGDCRKELVKSSPYAAFAAEAPATIVLGAVIRDSFTEQYRNSGLPLEAGFVTQNLRLEAMALNLRVGIAGSFDVPAVKKFLGIDLTPILLLTLGHRP